MKKLDIAVAADFLVMAATLIEIKSKMLLPRDPKRRRGRGIRGSASGTRRPSARIRKIQIRRRNALRTLDHRAGDLHPRPIDSDDNNAEVDATVFDLLTVFQKIVARHVDEIKMEIEREEISLADMIKSLKARIFELGEVSLLEFFEEMHSRRELVTAFIAVLEIVRTESVKLIAEKRRLAT